MHQPTTEPRRSIYYDYQIYPAWLASKNAVDSLKKVVIVGAGPVGLTTALELARHGVASVLLESEQQVSEGSRAIVFTRRSMEILQQVGVADRVTENGLPWRFGNSFFRGERVYRLEAPHSEDDRFFPMINLQQQYLEQYLVEAVLAQPLIELRWGNRVTGLTQEKGIVHVEVDTPEGPYKLDSEWLISAEGARSGIRAMMDLKLEGASYEGRFVIADIKIDLPLPTERLAFFDPDWNPGNTVLMHREPHGIWRVDYQLPANETPEDALKPEALASRINALLAQIGHAGQPWEMDWSSVYSARTLTLPDYVHDRVVFAGDSAHLLPIFGVRGANTGFQDAQSAAWHLAWVIKGLVTESFMQNYSRERVGAAWEIIEEAGKSTRFMTPPTRGFRLLRDAVLSLSLKNDFVRPLYHWRTSRPHEYTNSSLNSLGDDNGIFKSGPAHGAPPQNICLGPDDYLLDHLGGGLDLLYVTTAQALPAQIAKVIEDARTRGLKIRVSAIGATGHVQGTDQTFTDTNGHLREQYGIHCAGGAYLLRPDQHISARWVTLDAVRLQSALNKFLHSEE